jgi:hypothetical protein
MDRLEANFREMMPWRFSSHEPTINCSLHQGIANGTFLAL